MLKVKVVVLLFYIVRALFVYLFFVFFFSFYLLWFVFHLLTVSQYFRNYSNVLIICHLSTIEVCGHCYNNVLDGTAPMQDMQCFWKCCRYFMDIKWKRNLWFMTMTHWHTLRAWFLVFYSQRLVCESFESLLFYLFDVLSHSNFIFFIYFLN